MHILAVDDSRTNLYLLETMLKAAGYAVTTAVNGVEALDKLAGGGIDLVISDLLMPVMDGFELCRRIRRDEKLRRLPFIAYTATYTSSQDEALVLKIGADRFLQKPSEPETILEAVSTLSGGAAREDAGDTVQPEPEGEIYRLYSERLVRKLEQKMQQLEQEVRTRREAEKAAHAAVERWQTTFDAMLDPVVLLDGTGTVMQCNRAFALHIGRDPESVIGEKCHRLLHGTEEHLPGCPLVRARWSGSRETMDLTVGKKTYHVVIDPIRGGGGEPGGFVHILRDITDALQVQEVLSNLNAELEQRVAARTTQLEAVNRELEAFSYSLSHDLQAPLRSVDGYSFVLLEDYGNALDETGRTHLKKIRGSTQLMGSLIEDMLKLSRVTRSEPRSEPVDVSRIVREASEELQKSKPGRTVDVIVQDGVVVRGDPSLLRIALGNLLDNAWKFTFVEEHPLIEFRAVSREGWMECFIRDNGVGFDMAYANKLFGAFQRLHREEYPGTGIGLATVKRIVERQGGTVRAESKVGKGATFYFTLPEWKESALDF